MEDSDRFLYSKEAFEQTPSMAEGVTARQELTYRQKLSMLMQTIGLKSGLSQLAVNTSVIYMHRFFMYRSVKKMHRVHIGVAFVFAAGKVEESARKLEFLIRTAVEVIRVNKNRDYMDRNDELTYRMDCDWKSRMDTLIQTNCNIESTAYLEMRKIILDYEIEIYSVMGFHLQVIHPHNYVIRMCAMLGAENIKDISQYAYNLATASSQLTMMCLKYKPDLIATVCLNIASIAHNVKFVSMKNETIHWFQVHNPNTEFAVVQSVTEEFMNVIKDCSLLPTWMASLAKNGRVNARPMQGPSRAPGTSAASAPVSRQPSTAPPGASQSSQRAPPSSSHSGVEGAHSQPPVQVGEGSISEHTASQGHSNGQHRSQTSSSNTMRPPHSSRPHVNQPHHRSQPMHSSQHHQRSASVPVSSSSAPQSKTQQPRAQMPVTSGSSRPSGHPTASLQQRPASRPSSHSDHRHAQTHSRPSDHHRRSYTDSDRPSRQTANLPALAPDGRSPHTPAHSPPSSPPPPPQRPLSPQPEAAVPQPLSIPEEQKPVVPKLSLRDYRARAKPTAQFQDHPDALLSDNSLDAIDKASTNSPVVSDVTRASRPQQSTSQTDSPFSLPASDSNSKLPGLKIKIRPPKSTPSPAGPSGSNSRSSTPREEGEISDTAERKEGSVGIRIKLPVPKSESHSRDPNGSGESSHRHHHGQHREHRQHREHHKHKKHRHSSSRHSDGNKSSKRHSSLESSSHESRPAKQARSDTAVSGYPHRELQHQNSGFSINDAFTSTMPTNIFEGDSDEEDTQTSVNSEPPHHQRFHQLMAQHRANGSGNPPLPPISRRGPPPPPPPPPSTVTPPPPPPSY